MHRIFFAGWLPVVVAAAVAAQTPPVVTESQFLAVLDASHPAVVERSQAVSVARAEVVAAAALENPTLSVAREDPSGPAEQVDWTLSWRLPDRGRPLAIRAREEAVAAAEARFGQDLLSLRRTLREVYAGWAVAAARRERLSAHAERIEALAARERARAERGETSGLEAHRLTLAASVLRARAALAGTAAEAAEARARSWHPGLPESAEPQLPALPPSPPGESPLGPPFFQGGKRSDLPPRLRAAQAELDAAVLERQAVGRFVRSPEVLVGWQRQDLGPESVDGPLLGLAWSVPLFSRNQAGKALADARIAAARARLESVRREVDAAWSVALAAYHHVVAALAGARLAGADQERMLAGAEAAFRLGEASLTDLLETLRTAAEAEIAALDLHEAALAAHREVERLAGSPSLADPSSTPDPSKELTP